MSTQPIKKHLDQWIEKMILAKGSDLYIKTDSPLRARINGQIKLLSKGKVTEATMQELIKFLTDNQYKEFVRNKEFDGAYRFNGNTRLRYNIYEHVGGYGIVMRLIPSEIKTIEMLNLPTALHKLSELRRGLVLVTGTTGSGKTTTLATIIEEINQKYNRHIITIEDPVEYLFQDENSVIEQRELGTNTYSFERALRASMREDPDIIMVGEVRDAATADAIIQAVNTGHLVFTTMHTLSVRETIERLVGLFPPDEQNRIRLILASTLEAVISQRLIEGIDGNMIPAVEMMFKSPLTQELIRSQKDNEILDVIEKNRISYDSISFNRSLYELTLAGKITESQAYEYASSPADLKVLFTLSEEYNEREG